MSGQRSDMNKGKDTFNKDKGFEKDKNIGGGLGQGQNQGQRPNQTGTTNKGWGQTTGTNLPKDKDKTEKGKF